LKVARIGKMDIAMFHQLLLKKINIKRYYLTAENDSDIHPACWAIDGAR